MVNKKESFFPGGYVRGELVDQSWKNSWDSNPLPANEGVNRDALVKKKKNIYIYTIVKVDGPTPKRCISKGPWYTNTWELCHLLSRWYNNSGGECYWEGEHPKIISTCFSMNKPLNWPPVVTLVPGNLYPRIHYFGGDRLFSVNIVDYTTQFYRDCNKPWNKDPYEPTSRI